MRALFRATDWTRALNEVLSLVQGHLLAIIVCALTFYLLLVRVLRYRNLRNLEVRYAQHLKDPHSMDYKTAHEILRVSMLREYPFLFAFSLQWALIKSYAIANGTRVLVQTRRLTDERQVGRRSEDTALILYMLLARGIDSDGGLKALAKMNWIHARYGAKITNGDLIHTLALFVLEPPRWIARFEWRAMSELEKVALFVYWKEIGNRMGMQNIPETLDGLEKWTTEYEETAMVYSEDNRKCYEATVNLYLRNVPTPLKGFVARIADSFLEEYVRPSLGVSSPPAWAERTVRTFFAIRAFLLRHFFLPRFQSAEPRRYQSSDGRWQRDTWAFEPWFVRETAWMRLRKKLGLAPHRAPGPEYLSQGYLPEELGPQEFVKASREDVLKQADQLREYADSGGAVGMGCPFAFAR